LRSKITLRNAVVVVLLLALVSTVAPHLEVGTAQAFTGFSPALTQAVAGAVGAGASEVGENASMLSKVYDAISTLTSPLNALQTFFTKVLGIIVLTIMSLVVRISAAIMEGAMFLTANMSEVLRVVPMVDIGWALFRDLANMVFIFILLYIAIATILNTETNTRQMLVDVIITALLINFSLFLTKAMVDGSNIVALMYYNKMNAVQPVGGIARASQETTVKLFGQELGGQLSHGPTLILIDALGIATFYDPDAFKQAAATSQTNLTEGWNQFLRAAGGTPDAPYTELARVLLGAVLMLIVAFVFATAGLLLIIRIIVLMFLMMLAPLAFVARILPQAKGQWEKWWSTLMANLIWAPIYFAMLYVILTAIRGLNRSGTLAGGLGGLESDMGNLLGYIFIIVLLSMTIIIAKQLGLHGGEMVHKWSENAAKWAREKVRQGQGVVGRHTIGRAARYTEEAAHESPFWNSVVGSKIREFTTQPLADAKFGGTMSAWQMKEKDKVRQTGQVEAERLQKFMHEAEKGDAANPHVLEDLAIRLAPQTLAHTDMRFLRKLPIGILPDTHFQALMASDKVQKDKDELARLRLKPMQLVRDKVRAQTLATIMLQQHPELKDTYFEADGLKLFKKKDLLDAKLAEGKALADLPVEERLSPAEETLLAEMKSRGISWSAKEEKAFDPAFEFIRAKNPKELGQLNRVDPDAINELAPILNWSQLDPLRKSDDITFKQRNGRDGGQLRDYKDRMLLDALAIEYGVSLTDANGKLRTLEERYDDFMKVNGLLRKKVRQFGVESIENAAHSKHSEYTQKDIDLWGKLKAISPAQRDIARHLFEQHHEGRSDSELTKGRTYQRNDAINFASLGAGSVPFLIDRDNDKKEEQGGQLLTAIAEDNLTEQNKEFLAKVWWDRDADKYLKNWEEIARRNGWENNERVKLALKWKNEGEAGKKKFKEAVKAIKHTDFFAGSTTTGGTKWDELIAEDAPATGGAGGRGGAAAAPAGRPRVAPPASGTPPLRVNRGGQSGANQQGQQNQSGQNPTGTNNP